MGSNGSRTDAYARLAVEVGVNVEPGQDVLVDCRIEHAEFARALARAVRAAVGRRRRIGAARRA